jgi:dolichyl-phosphate-mannose--protein O-mannosyl transferase
LVATPDDLSLSRGKIDATPRDNILFELGLFIGRLGRNRTFLVCNHDHPVKLPSDLNGWTRATYGDRADGNWHAETGPASNLIREVIKSDQGFRLLEANSCVRPIRYGDVIRLRHLATGKCLWSDNIKHSHPSTSGQHLVAATSNLTAKNLWIITMEHDGARSTASPVLKHGDTIRLEHISTGRNLHSHDTCAPLNLHQFEVTCYGADGRGDTNDNWQVELLDSEFWTENSRVRLIHAHSKRALHSHRHAHSDYTKGHQEVTCYPERDDNDIWVVARHYDL